jgi:hypothetical protein
MRKLSNSFGVGVVHKDTHCKKHREFFSQKIPQSAGCVPGYPSFHDKETGLVYTMAPCAPFQISVQQNAEDDWHILQNIPKMKKLS